MSKEVYIVDGIRTPIGNFCGTLSTIRTDDLAAHSIASLMVRHPNLDLELVEDVIFGCANQAGEDNRNVARMAGLLAGSFVVETIFGIPGLGRFYVEAAFNRDYTMILGSSIFFSCLIIGLNLVSDLVAAAINPKLR